MKKKWPPADPDEKIDSKIDWMGTAEVPGRLYGTGRTIVASTWTVPAGITKILDARSNTATLIRTTSGTVGESPEFTNHITLDNGEEWEQTVKLPIRVK